MILFEWVQERKTAYTEARGINILYTKYHSVMLKVSIFDTLNARMIMCPMFYSDTSNSERYEMLLQPIAVAY
jgi:hypothetical protein